MLPDAGRAFGYACCNDDHHTVKQPLVDTATAWALSLRAVFLGKLLT